MQVQLRECCFVVVVLCLQVCASAVLCWGEAVACLGPQLIGDLQRAIKALLAILKATWSKDNAA